MIFAMSLATGTWKLPPGSIAVGSYGKAVIAIHAEPSGCSLLRADRNGGKRLTDESVRAACADGGAVWAVFTNGAIGRYAENRWSFVGASDAEFPDMSCTKDTLAVSSAKSQISLISAEGDVLGTEAGRRIRFGPSGDILLSTVTGRLGLRTENKASREFGAFRDFGWIDRRRFYAVSNESVSIFSANAPEPVRHRIPSRWRRSIYYGSIYEPGTSTVYLCFNMSAKNFEGRSGVLAISVGGRTRDVLVGTCNTSLCLVEGVAVAIGQDGFIRSLRN